ncbi:MAG: hypothetical protein GY898_01675 [Proteobacteria bacterium]|nr:hypothetical protein [Pseudomonadota bacterium]
MRRLLLLLLAVALLPTAALADGACDESTWGLPTGPVRAGLLEGELGAAHRVCGRSEIALDGGGLLLVDLPNFYGRLAAAIRIDGSWAWGPRGELFGSWEAFRYDSLITPLSSSAIGIGHLTVGAGYRFVDVKRVSLGVNGKVVLPTAVPLYRNVAPFGIDLGLAARFMAHKRVHFHGQAGLLHSFAVGKGPGQPRVGAVVTAGAELAPAPQFAVAIDLHAGFGHTAPVDVFAAALALRFSDNKRFGFSVGATVPLLGRERAAARVDLRASVRFGPITPGVPRAPKGS